MLVLKCKFDCVICFHTIYHTNFVGVKKAIDEIYRVLNENGEGREETSLGRKIEQSGIIGGCKWKRSA